MEQIIEKMSNDDYLREVSRRIAELKRDRYTGPVILRLDMRSGGIASAKLSVDEIIGRR